MPTKQHDKEIQSQSPAKPGEISNKPLKTIDNSKELRDSLPSPEAGFSSIEAEKLPSLSTKEGDETIPFGHIPEGEGKLGEGITEEMWAKMAEYANSKGLKGGNYKKLNSGGSKKQSREKSGSDRTK